MATKHFIVTKRLIYRGSGLYLTPGNIQSISNRRLAAVSAVLPLKSYGGDTCNTSYSW